jgi:hypothetical protein
MDFVPLAVLGALVYKFVDFLKFITNKDWNGVKTQIVAWCSGIVGIALFAKSDFSSVITFGDLSLQSINFASQVILGLSATSIFSAFYDLKKSIDSSDSAKTSPLT